jgi:hypothetical protein
MKKRFLAWMEVAILSFLGLRSPLPWMFILPVHACLGLCAPSLLPKTQQKKRMQPCIMALRRLSAYVPA